MIKLENTIASLQYYLNEISFLESSEFVQLLTIPGDGNMNFTLRVETNLRTFIVKQSRGYVEKYPDVPAPEDRILKEAEFYALIKKFPNLTTHTPELLHIDKFNFVLIMEDLGKGSDMSYVYHSGTKISEEQIAYILDFLLELHTNVHKNQVSTTIENRDMRILNHQHIFHYPFIENNGVQLEDITKGLLELKKYILRDGRIIACAHELGNQYLKNGDYLLHGDYYPGSFLQTESDLYFIDPEFCFFGDREFDLGVLLAHMYLGKQPKESILKVRRAYGHKITINEPLLDKYIGIEILRRIFGLAQLPLSMNLGEKKSLVDMAKTLLTTS